MTIIAKFTHLNELPTIFIGETESKCEKCELFRDLPNPIFLPISLTSTGYVTRTRIMDLYNSDYKLSKPLNLMSNVNQNSDNEDFNLKKLYLAP